MEKKHVFDNEGLPAEASAQAGVNAGIGWETYALWVGNSTISLF